MNDPKPFASLAPLLLARKGGAKPAMRRGIEEDARGSANDQGDVGFVEDPALFERPEIKRQQERLLHSIADANDAAARAPRTVASTAEGRRAAFTLRFDEERHLRLKLASAVKGVSSQALLLQAFDRLMDDMPDIEMLAAQVTRGSDEA